MVYSCIEVVALCTVKRSSSDWGLGQEIQEQLLSYLLPERNNLKLELRLNSFATVFNRKLPSMIYLLPNLSLEFTIQKRLSYLTKVGVDLSTLNFHMFKHNWEDTINLLCSISNSTEDREHLLLLCPSLMFNIEIILLEWTDWQGYLCEASIFQMMLSCSIYCMVINIWTETYSNWPCVSFTKLVGPTKISRNFSYVQRS